MPPGVSQTPTARTFPCAEIAWVIRPAGLVKLIRTAFGEQRLSSSQYDSTTGMVRSAIAQPPGPVVSWPTMPRRSATSSSMTRPRSPPTRIAENT